MRVAVITNRRYACRPGGLWTLLHSRNMALTSLGCELEFLYTCDRDEITPPNLPEIPYRTRGYRLGSRIGWRTSVTARRLLRTMTHDAIAGGAGLILVSGLTAVSAVLDEVQGRLPVVLDLDGSIRERFDYAPYSAAAALGYLHKLWTAKRTFSRLTGALIVSKYLAAECRRFAPDLPTYWVPCASPHAPSWSHVAEQRQSWRAFFQFDSTDLVFAHSGGLEPWQRMEPMLTLLDGLLAHGLNARLLLLTPDRELAARTLRHRPTLHDRVCCRSCPNGEHLDALAAADFGLLLRDDKATNRGAFPNKTDEYWSVGVPVIATSGLASVAELVSRYPSAGFVIGGPAAILNSDRDRIAIVAKRSDNERARVFRDLLDVRRRISFEHTLAPFLNSIEKHRAAPGNA
jgi:hypothetical protein